MTAESLLTKISKEEPSKAKEMLKALTQEEWVNEHRFWLKKLAIRRWELESVDKQSKTGTQICADIQNFLNDHALIIDDMFKMPIEEVKQLVKEAISFTEVVFNEKMSLANLLEGGTKDE